MLVSPRIRATTAAVVASVVLREMVTSLNKWCDAIPLRPLRAYADRVNHRVLVAMGPSASPLTWIYSMGSRQRTFRSRICAAGHVISVSGNRTL